MKRFYLFAAVAVVALAVSCSREIERSTDGMKTLLLSAGVDDTMTKMTYTSDGKEYEGFTLAWDATDRIELYAFDGTDGYRATTFSVTPQADSSKATIALQYPEAMAGKSGVKWSAYINVTDNWKHVGTQRAGFIDSYSEHYNVCWDGREQDGTEGSVHHCDLFYAGGDDFFADLASGTISFRPLTAVLKIRLRLPDSEEGTTLSDIKIKGDGNFYSSTLVIGNEIMNYDGREVFVDDQDITDHVATFYVGVWAGKISNTFLSARVGVNSYSANIRKAETTLEAGAVYTLDRTAAPVKKVTIYKTREACTYQFVPGLTPSDGGWSSDVSYDASTGVISFNEASGYETYVLEFADGSSVSVTRMNLEDIGDLSGNYTLHSWVEHMSWDDAYSGEEYETKVTIEQDNSMSADGNTSDYSITGLFGDIKVYVFIREVDELGPAVCLYTGDNYYGYGFMSPLFVNYNGYKSDEFEVEWRSEHDHNDYWIPMKYDPESGRISSFLPFPASPREDDNEWIAGFAYGERVGGDLTYQYRFTYGGYQGGYQDPCYFEKDGE